MAKNNHLGRHWETTTIATPTHEFSAEIRFEAGTGLWHGYMKRPTLSEIHVSSKLYEEIVPQLQQKVSEQLQPVYRPYLRIRLTEVCAKKDPYILGEHVVTLTPQMVEFSQYIHTEHGRLCRDDAGWVRLYTDADSALASSRNSEELYVSDTPKIRATLAVLAKELAEFQASLHLQLRALAVDVSKDYPAQSAEQVC